MNLAHDELQVSLEAALGRHHVPGASIAVLHQGVRTAVVAGTANLSSGVAMTPGTVMHIGSITKVINATLVMQLVDEGQVDLDEPVLRYLPDLRLGDRDALRQITVRMLLNHTSGIDGDMLPDQGHDEETIDKAIQRFAKLGHVHAPGSEYSYCNAGTVIAGYLVQRLRGKSWYRVVRERIFEPLKMEHAAALPEEALLHRASVGHYLDPATKMLTRTSFAFLPMSFGPAGTTLMMSATDLVTFAKMHMDDGSGENGVRILSADSTKAMQRMTVDNRGKAYTYGDGVGLGWTVFDCGLLHHVGGGPGIISALYVHPGKKFAAAILTNAEHGLALINDFMEPWMDEVVGVKPLGVVTTYGRVDSSPQAQKKLDTYVGEYEDIFKRFNVTRGESGLVLSQQLKLAVYESISTKPSEPVPLLPLGEDRFILGSDSQDNHLWDIFRTFTFRNPDDRGRMRHIGFGFHVYPRVQ